MSDYVPFQAISYLYLCVFQACGKVVKYLGVQVDSIRFSLDGKNVDAVLMEIGMRVHRVIYDHLLQYQYNSMGRCDCCVTAAECSDSETTLWLVATAVSQL